MSELLNPEDYTEFEEDDDIDPTLPTKGPLYEGFNEMLKIANSYSLSSEEVWELTHDLHHLLKKRSYSLSDENQHTIEEGGLMLDPLDQQYGHSALKSVFYEYLDKYEPLVDGFSILVTRDSEIGGRYDCNFDDSLLVPFTESEDDEEQNV